MPACGEWAWWHPEQGYKRFYCGNSACHRPECKNLFWSRRVRLITALISEHDLTKFFTLTLDPSMIKGDPWKYIAHPWSKFRKRMARLHGKWKFVAVLERHKNRDVPHIHGFTDVWMHQRLWSSHWHGSCGGSIVWVEKVESPELSSYVSKQIEVARYVGKEQLAGGYKHRSDIRTLWRSKGLKAKFELTEGSGWCILKENIYKEDGSYTDWADKKGVWKYGKEKCFRQDVERACSALPAPCAQSGVEVMEAQESKNGQGEAETYASAT